MEKRQKEVIVTLFLIAAMTRVMVGMMLDTLQRVLYLNHIVLPAPGWKLQAIEITLTVVIITPIFGTIMLYS